MFRKNTKYHVNNSSEGKHNFEIKLRQKKMGKTYMPNKQMVEAPFQRKLSYYKTYVQYPKIYNHKIIYNANKKLGARELGEMSPESQQQQGRPGELGLIVQ